MASPHRVPHRHTSSPLSQVWTSSVGSVPLGAIYNSTPRLAGRRPLSCTSLPSVKRKILKNGAAICTACTASNELFRIEAGVQFSPLTAQSTQEPAACCQVAILDLLSVAVWRSGESLWITDRPLQGPLDFIFDCWKQKVASLSDVS